MTKKATMVPAEVTAKPSARPAKPVSHCDVLTTANGQIGAYGYSRSLIITGVPAALVDVHAAWMNADAAAVKAARAAGADVVPFRG